MEANITIIGGGIVGLSCAYELCRRGYQNVVLLEKNEGFGFEQSSHNAGVIHTGVFNEPGSLKQKLCIEGSRELYDFCEKRSVPFKKTGKLIVATDSREAESIDRLVEISKSEGINAEMIGREKAKSMEPCLDVVCAAYLKDTGAIDASAYIAALESVSSDAVMLKGCEVMGIEDKGSYFSVSVNQPGSKEKSWKFDTRKVINAAGLAAVDIARLSNNSISHRNVFLRGDFYTIPRENIGISMQIYPTPFKVENENGFVFYDCGIHVSPQVCSDEQCKTVISDQLLLGPSFKIVDSPDHNSDFEPEETFYDRIRKFIPSITDHRIKRAYSGFLIDIYGSKDYTIERDSNNPNMINLFGMESPAFTSALAIGKYVAEMVK